MGTDSIEVPIFYGDDPEEVEPWVSWIGDFAYDQGFSDFETRQFAYGFIEGEAHDWYCEELSRSVFRSWADLKLRIFQRFGKSREDTTAALSFQDRMNQLSSLLDLWNEEDEAKKQSKEEVFAPEDSIQRVRHVGGSPEEVDQILDPTQPTAKPEEKNDMSIKSHQKSTHEQDAPCTKMTESPIPLFEGTNVRSRDQRVEQYFERGKRKEGELFGFDNIERREQHHQEVEKLTEIGKYINVCQVFDKMHLRGKRIRKKKRWKKIAKKISSPYKKSEGNRKIDGVVIKNVARRLHRLVMEYMAEKMTSAEIKKHQHRVLARRLLLTFKMMKRKAKWEQISKGIKLKCQTVSARRQGMGVKLYRRRVFSRKRGSGFQQKKRKRAELRLMCVAHIKFLSLVTIEWTKFLLEWKKHKIRKKYRNIWSLIGSLESSAQERNQ